MASSVQERGSRAANERGAERGSAASHGHRPRGCVSGVVSTKGISRGIPFFLLLLLLLLLLLVGRDRSLACASAKAQVASSPPTTTAAAARPSVGRRLVVERCFKLAGCRQQQGGSRLHDTCDGVASLPDGR